MPRRVLILCDAFMPPMYGTRMRYLLQNLSDQWQADVACEQVPEYPYCPPNAQVHFFHYYPKKQGLGLILWHLRWLSDKLFHTKERRFLRYLNREFRNQKIDIVLTSAYTFPLHSARRFTQRHNIPLLLDLRDVFEQMNASTYFTKRLPAYSLIGRKIATSYTRYLLRERNNTLAAAAAVTTVSEWHRNLLMQYNSNTHLIYNGYDDKSFVACDTPVDRFSIVYTGRVYDRALQDPSLLFEALQDMPRLDNLQVDWFTDEEGRKTIQRLSQQYGVDDLMVYHDYVQTEAVASLLQKSSIVLVLTNKSAENGPHGVLTTKFFEALGTEKPVLCVRSDEECLAQVITETNAGLAATTSEQVEAFIKEKYAEWKQNGFTRQPVNKKTKPVFSRQHQAKQFERLMADILDK